MLFFFAQVFPPPSMPVVTWKSPQVLVSICAAIIAVAAAMYSGRQAYLGRKQAMMPILAFYLKPEGWAIRNVGQGPAVNTIFYNFDAHNKLCDKILLYPIQKDEEVLFINEGEVCMMNAETLGTVCEDALHAHKYRSKVNSHRFQFSERALFDERDTQKEVFERDIGFIKRSS